MTEIQIALLRAVNVGNRKVAMADLRSLCIDLGWVDVRTYIQSGNIVFKGSGSQIDLADSLASALAERYGFDVPVIVRSAYEWNGYVRANPFPEASAVRPNRVMMAISQERPAPDAASALRVRAKDGERIEFGGDVLWIDYGKDVAVSRISPGLLDRVVGSPVTTRNWRTVLKLNEMAND